jgi:uncharacterized protein YcfL
MKVFPRLTYIALFFLIACSSHQKKILVYANSKIEVDESQKKITIQDGTTQVETELNINSSGPVVLDITDPRTKYSVVATDDGYWLANLGMDTIVGSLQHTGTTKQTRITQEQLQIQLDSLNKLVRGANISTAAKNYFILPGKIVKITSLTEAKIFGPYTPVPGAFDAGSVPEVYKFYNINEVYDIIRKLTEMSKYKYEKETGKQDDNDDSVYTIHPTKK